MNLQVIEETWKRIKNEVEMLKFANPKLSTSEFVRRIIFDWHRQCKTKKIPEFKSVGTILVNIYTNPRQWIKIKAATRGLEHKQFTEAAWLWYKVCKVKEGI